MFHEQGVVFPPARPLLLQSHLPLCALTRVTCSRRGFVLTLTSTPSFEPVHSQSSVFCLGLPAIILLERPPHPQCYYPMADGSSPAMIGPLTTKITGLVIVGYFQLDGTQSGCSFVQPSLPPMTTPCFNCAYRLSPSAVERERDRESSRTEDIGGRDLTATIYHQIFGSS